MRRTRLAWGWQDEVEAPADPAVQCYRVRIAGADGSVERDVAESDIIIESGEVAALGAGPLIIEVRQIGALALSRPAAISVN
jgi:hypothetical protein